MLIIVGGMGLIKNPSHGTNQLVVSWMLHNSIILGLTLLCSFSFHLFGECLLLVLAPLVGPMSQKLAQAVFERLLQVSRLLEGLRLERYSVLRSRTWYVLSSSLLTLSLVVF